MAMLRAMANLVTGHVVCLYPEPKPQPDRKALIETFEPIKLRAFEPPPESDEDRWRRPWPPPKTRRRVY
jgi:hypothetical protein